MQYNVTLIMMYSYFKITSVGSFYGMTLNGSEGKDGDQQLDQGEQAFAR